MRESRESATTLDFGLRRNDGDGFVTKAYFSDKYSFLAIHFSRDSGATNFVCRSSVLSRLKQVSTWVTKIVY
jgi:hypothetical protein